MGAVLCRQTFPLVKKIADDLTASLKKLGPSAAVDMDDAGMRFTLDVVALVPPFGIPTCLACPHTACKVLGPAYGQAGFGYDFEAVKLEPNRVIHALPRALEEIQRRMTNPLQVLACTEARPTVSARQAAEGALPQAL